LQSTHSAPDGSALLATCFFPAPQRQSATLSRAIFVAVLEPAGQDLHKASAPVPEAKVSAGHALHERVKLNLSMSSSFVK